MKAKSAIFFFVLPFLLLVSYIALTIGNDSQVLFADNMSLNPKPIENVLISTQNQGVTPQSESLPSSQITSTVTFTSYLPMVMRSKPLRKPCDSVTENMVLQLSDMPPGYVLDEDETGIVEFSDEVQQMGVMTSCQTTYNNLSQLFSGNVFATSVVIIFQTTEGAQSYIQLVQQNLEDENNDDDDIIAQPISSPTFGDETIAYQLTNDTATGHIITFRQGNIVADIATASLSFIANFDETLYFAGIVLDKINNQSISRQNLSTQSSSEMFYMNVAEAVSKVERDLKRQLGVIEQLLEKASEEKKD